MTQATIRIEKNMLELIINILFEYGSNVEGFVDVRPTPLNGGFVIVAFLVRGAVDLGQRTKSKLSKLGEICPCTVELE